ncbi:hypothetical protein DFH08DRAFT_442126 [Mycena albidolilacea]|uniref:Secreted protein n=1 Tax=Mycena albidolilacea TaxID=1033008 RepID=A0AAD7F0A1_9AGAR|nr:hypothetical protein DFH08DRAFT_442126 [Mycena albidolilacea]
MPGSRLVVRTLARFVALFVSARIAAPEYSVKIFHQPGPRGICEKPWELSSLSIEATGPASKRPFVEAAFTIPTHGPL